MGGEIRVDSQLGKGSIFRIEIDIEECTEGAALKKEPRRVEKLRPGQQVVRVLIADDKDDNRTLLAQMLESVGFEIREVANGEQAVRAFENWHPDLILMDTRMPVMNGYEAIKQIRSSAGGGAPRIVSVTASAFGEDRENAIEIGADDFLGKPFSEDVLFDKIKVLLGVEYVYTDARPPLNPEPDGADVLFKEKVAALPDTLINRLHHAVLSADLDRMLDIIHQIEKHDVAVAGSLRRLAENYEYSALMERTTGQEKEDLQ
jgi:CheY-like chemotaxis protein